MGKYHFFQEITEMGEIYTDSKMCWLGGGGMGRGGSRGRREGRGGGEEERGGEGRRGRGEGRGGGGEGKGGEEGKRGGERRVCSYVNTPMRASSAKQQLIRILHSIPRIPIPLLIVVAMTLYPF